MEETRESDACIELRRKWDREEDIRIDLWAVASTSDRAEQEATGVSENGTSRTTRRCPSLR